MFKCCAVVDVLVMVRSSTWNWRILRKGSNKRTTIGGISMKFNQYLERVEEQLRKRAV